MNTFVTGGSGFLGRHLVEALRADGALVDAPSSADVDLTSDTALLVARPEQRYDTIYHLAAWTRAGRFCQERAGEQWLVNQRINTNVLGWWQRAQPQAKLIAFGTSASYPETSTAHDEAEYMDGEPPAAYRTYAMTKRMLLTGLESVGDQFGFDWLYLVPSTLYGPRYHVDGRELHFVYDIARKIVRGKRYGEPVRLWGTGEERRELVHVADAVMWTRLLTPHASRTVINLGAGTGYSIAEIAQELCDVLGFPFTEVAFEADRAVGAHTKVLSRDRLLSALEEPPEAVPLAQGLAEVAAWASEHIEELG